MNNITKSVETNNNWQR